MIPGNTPQEFFGAAAAAAAGGAPANRSVRFNSADSASLSKTFSSTGNRKTYTLSLWCKRSKLGGAELLLTRAGNPENTFRFNSDALELFQYSGGFTWQLVTTQLFRDPSAWYHILIAFDTTQATSSNRVKLYVNGTQVTAFSTASYPSLNFDGEINTNTAHEIGVGQFNGYLALVHFIDGQALTPSSFGETSATTGQWIAKTYSGTYGTNGFFLDFSDNSAATATTLGKDKAGSNNWTPNNLSVTAGSGNDSLRDHPTSAGTSTGLGGEVSGNYCTINPLTSPGTAYLTISNGNLDQLALTETVSSTKGTIGVRSGKWYWEVQLNTLSSGGVSPRIGICRQSAPTISQAYGADEWSLFMTDYNPFGGQGGHNNSFVGTYSPFQVGDIGMFALDMDNAKIYFGKNGTWLNSGNPVSGTGAFFTDVTGEIFPLINTGYYTSVSCNFGQRAFAYTAPSGFSPLVDTLLPTPTIAKPNTVMDVKLYTGNASTQTISGLAFSPDLVWTKSRANSFSHLLYDTVRGATKYLTSNNADAEGTGATTLTAFNSDGFTLGSGENSNQSGGSVAWAFDAGSSNATNTSGTITSTVRANISAGFSVVTYTGTASNRTVGHGLGVAPSLIIVKNRSSAVNWRVYHSALGGNKAIFLNTTDAADTWADYWNNTAPTSTTFSIGPESGVNGSGNNMVAYCWAPVAGLSSFGSYVGNGSSDGPFVYTGFRPRWVLIKMSSSTGSWYLIDTARLGYNPDNNPLYPNLSVDEQTDDIADILSNGFKIRNSFAGVNTSSGTYVWAAFAENPFAYARAR